MLFKKVLKLENEKITVLEQKIVINDFNNVDIYDYTINYGGCTVINDELWINYAYTGETLWFDNNKIKLLLPEKVYNQEFRHLLKILDIMDIPFDTTSANGYWLDDEGHQILDDLEVLSFNITNLDKLEFLIKIVSRLALTYKEDCIALYINDALLLIEGGMN